MSLSIGLRLGPYEIQAPAGAGGMGEVYKAVDTRLKRTVAIKVLPHDQKFRTKASQKRPPCGFRAIVLESRTDVIHSVQSAMYTSGYTAINQLLPLAGVAFSCRSH
jgi:serine/threonine protein kinase